VVQKHLSTVGLVLAKRNYGETDRLYVIYTRDYGKQLFISKGVRRSHSRKRGHLEIFNLVKIQAVSTRGFCLITEAEVVDTYFEIRSDLKKVSLGYYVVEVLSKAVRENEPHPELYRAVCQLLTELGKLNKGYRSWRERFIYLLLTTLGYWPKEKQLFAPDEVLMEVLERKINSVRVGRSLLK